MLPIKVAQKFTIVIESVGDINNHLINYIKKGLGLSSPIKTLIKIKCMGEDFSPLF